MSILLARRSGQHQLWWRSLNSDRHWGIGTENANGIGLNVLNSYWFIKSDHLGKVGIGKQSPAGDNAAILVDGSGSLVPSNWVMFDNALFTISQKGFSPGGLNPYRGMSWGYLGGYCAFSSEPIGGDCVAVPSNVIRYDSPVFAGFSFSADWGGGDSFLQNPANAVFCSPSAGAFANDLCNQNGRHEIGTSTAAMRSSVTASSWPPQPVGPIRTTVGSGGLGKTASIHPGTPCIDNTAVGYWQSGVYIEHVATGVFVYGAYGREFENDVAAGFNSEPDHWMVKAGLRERWHPMGHTVLYGSYAQRNDMFADGVVNGDIFGGGQPGGFGTSSLLAPCKGGGIANDCHVDVNHTELNEWSIGVVQEIDAAAMSMWVQYDHFDITASGCERYKDRIDVNGKCSEASAATLALEMFPAYRAWSS